MKQYPKQYVKEVANWLKPYTHEVISSVIENIDEILNNEFALKLLHELYERECKENERFENSIRNMMEDFTTFREYNPHSHVLEHSNSYRDVLYDMYIRNL